MLKRLGVVLCLATFLLAPLVIILLSVADPLFTKSGTDVRNFSAVLVIVGIAILTWLIRLAWRYILSGE
jgi:hypothetical protein